MVSDFIVAVDFGTSNIVGVVAQKNEEGKLALLASERVDSKGIRYGRILNVSDVAFLLKEVIRKLENREPLKSANVHIKKVYVGLTGQTVKTIDNSTSRILGSDEEVTESLVDAMLEENRKIQIENYEVLDVIPQEYLVDDELEADPIGFCCRNLQGRYKVIIGRPDLKRNLERVFEKASVELAGMFLQPLAVPYSLLSKGEKELGCAFLDFGAGTTSLSVFQEGYLRHLAVIPFGGNVVTEDLKDLNLLAEKAELMKMNHGNAMPETEPADKRVIIPSIAVGQKETEIPTKLVSSIIEARITEILGIVNRQLNESRYGQQLRAGIVISGGGSKLKNIDKLVSLRTGMNVRPVNFDELLQMPGNEDFKDPYYAQLIGLLCHADACCVTPKEQEVQVTKEKTKKVTKSIKTAKKFNDIMNRLGGLFDDSSNVKM